MYKIFVLSCVFAVSSALQSDVRCMRCDHVANPGDCDTIATCGHDEICFTREYVDHHDKTAYHLGCESAQICSLYKNAEQIFIGRRDVTDFMEDKPHYCFECCHDNECNPSLCSGSSTQMQPQTNELKSTQPSSTSMTSAPSASSVAKMTTTHRTHAQGCPTGYVGWPSHNTCYLFNQSSSYWSDARSMCQSAGGDLVSINSQQEDSFIVSQLTQLNPPDTMRGMWIGGTFDHQTSKYKWVDGSDVTFERYKVGSPHNKEDYRLDLINPAVNKLFAGWPWGSDIGAIYKRGAICELQL